ncbi:MAG TPA: hypothetical protein VG265_08390 [Gaiellaceae bacterium]|nr:hypothetical protein [Gaiellaceae bacterium]
MALALTIGLLVVGQAGARGVVLPTLYVNYTGTNCTFTLVNDSRTSFTTLAPGTYQLTLAADDFVSCPNALPDFQLSGPGVLVNSPIDNGTGAAADYTIVLQPSSTYVAQDLNQPVSKISFATTATGAPAQVSLPTNTVTHTTTTSSTGSPVGTDVSTKAKAAFRGTLDATVNSSGKPTLTFKGKSVSQLLAGKYTLEVVDHSKSGGFVLQEPPKLATTASTVPFIGKKTLTVNLTAGQALFFPTFIGKKTYFIVVAAATH